MDLNLALNVVIIVILQEVNSHSTRKGINETTNQIECIYHNLEHIRCTWKPKEKADHGINDKFFYWFVRKMRKGKCEVIEGTQKCELKKRKKNNDWLCLYISISRSQLVVPMSCFHVQDHGLHRLVLNKSNSSELVCLNSDANYFSCSWKKDKEKRKNITYDINYMLSKRMPLKQCQQYVRDESHNISCHFNASSATVDLNLLHAYVMDKNNVTRIGPQKFLLIEHVKMNPPLIQTARLDGKEVLLKWNRQPGKNADYLQYELIYKSNWDSDWKTEPIRGLSFQLLNVDPAKCYFFHLRSKIHNLHAINGYWSDWSPVLIWKGKTVVDSCPSPGINMLFLVLLPAALLVLVILICVLYRVKRVRTRLFPGIPDPKHLFVDLFDDHNGNFQEWIGVSKDLHTDCQSNCTANECQVEEDSVRVNAECEDSLVEITERNERNEPAPENINECIENSEEDIPSSQLLGPKPAAIDMSRFAVDGSMYIML